MVGRPSVYTPTHDGAGRSDDADVFVLPTSFAQERLWFLDQLQPGHAAYNVPLNFRFVGALDVGALAGALSVVVERHETLRTVFELQDGVPQQVILPARTVPLPVTDLRSLDAEARADALARHVRIEGTTPFDLATGPVFRTQLVRLADDDHVLLMTVHHIAMDGWSLAILQRELAGAYTALAHGDAPALPELAIQYADFAAWQRERLDGGELESQLAYWQQRLAAPLPAFDLATDRARLPGRTRIAEAVPVEISTATSEALLALGRAAGATPFITLLAAFQVLLHRYTGEDDVIVGSPVAGRTQRETESLIGLFVNSLAMRTDLSGTPTFRDVLARVRETVVGALAHQDVPFERVVNAVQPHRDAARTPIFQTMFSFQDFGGTAPFALRDVTVSRIPGARGTAKFELQLMMNHGPRGFRGSLEYDASLFDEASAQRFARHFTVLVDAIAAAPDRPVDQLSLLDDAERELVTHALNATDAPWPRDETLHGLVARQAEATPDRVAVVDAKGNRLTYAELTRRAGALATRLQAAGVGPGTLVGVCMTRSVDLVVALLGVLEAGGAYVPLDPAYPPERLAFMLEDSGAPVVVTGGDAARGASAGWRAGVPADVTVIDLAASSDRRAGDQMEAPRAAPSDVAYVIYTSGSTGRPKGVLIEHRNAVAFVSWALSVFSAEELAGVLAGTSVCFDLSIFELFVPLSAGGTAIIVADGLSVATAPAGVPVTLLNTVPSVIAELLRQDAIPSSVQSVNLAGEPLAQRIVDALYALPHVRRVHDLYGPSETTTYSTYALREAGGRSTIGRPIANTRVYVLGADGAPVPVGLPGELFIGGAGVARGYHQRPDLTADRFRVDPFAPATDGTPPMRCYRTGDRVRWLTDGRLEYLGRLDHQVKLRGFRIELGEVESTLVAQPGVADAVAIVREDEPGDPRLVAYVVAADGSPSTQPSALVSALRARLPAYMVPSAIVVLPSIPRTPNGKLDRAQLPLPGRVSGASSGGYVAPRTTIEHQFVQVWETLLPVHPIGIRDDFFELGGHSLLAVRMLSEMERLIGRRVPLTTLFHGATIEQLATGVESSMHAEAEPPFVVLEPEERGTPIVFLHGDVTGGGWYSRRLAPLLDIGAPMILLPTLRESTPDAPASIEEMASHHLAALRRLQPNGPYRLVGYCAGGTIAFEMARQLHEQGQRVERLVLIDSVTANARFRWLEWLVAIVAHDRCKSRRLEKRAYFLRRLGYYVARLRAVRRFNNEERLRWLGRNVIARLPLSRDPVDRVLDQQSEDALSAAELDARPGQDVLRFQSRAARAFMPRPYDGAVDLIVAADRDPDEERLRRIRANARGWDRVARRVRVHPIASTHVGLITDQIVLLAESLRECLAAPDEDR